MKDQKGLPRVKAKILERDDDFLFIYLNLLSQKHHVTGKYSLEATYLLLL